MPEVPQQTLVPPGRVRSKPGRSSASILGSGPRMTTCMVLGDPASPPPQRTANQSAPYPLIPAAHHRTSQPNPAMRRFLSFLALMGGTVAALIALLIGTAQAADEIETPDHDVLHSAPAAMRGAGAIEHRRYRPMIVAETTVEAASRDAASSKGFMPLAGYIFGNNAPSESIAMTAPVTTAPAESGLSGAMPGGDGEQIAMTAPVTTRPEGEGADRYTVQFMMPSRYTMETLPAPRDPNVTLREVPGRDLVALRFRGNRSTERVEEAAGLVDAFITELGLEPTGPYATAGYDGPDVPESERRWEVQRPVAAN